MTHLPFANREEAAYELAKALGHYKGQNPLLLAIPRGAVPMGAIIAAELQGDLDVALVRKIGAPGNAELAVGAIDEEGHIELNDIAHLLRLSEHYIQEASAKELAKIRERRARYTPVYRQLSPENRVVIIVDDGIATGATMLTAVHATQRKKPEKVVVAAAVASMEAAERLQQAADETVFLAIPPDFGAVGAYFIDFRQVEDDEVITMLKNFGSP